MTYDLLRYCAIVSHPSFLFKTALSALAPLDYESAEDIVNSDWIRMEPQGRLVSAYEYITACICVNLMVYEYEYACSKLAIVSQPFSMIRVQQHRAK